MADQFPHTSRAGHFGLSFDQELTGYLEHVAAALIPGDGTYPSGAEAQVVTFIQDRASETDLGKLLTLSRQWPATGPIDAAASVRAMEVGDPASFAFLRELVYHGYYSSRRVLAVLADRGYGYHGAPQPLGYRIEDDMRMPSKSRGSYISTEDVTRGEN